MSCLRKYLKVIFVGGLLFLWFIPTTKDHTLQKQIMGTITDLRTNGDKVLVDLSGCDIKEHNYTEQREKNGYTNELLTLDFKRQIQNWNAIGRGSMRNLVQVHVKYLITIFSPRR